MGWHGSKDKMVTTEQVRVFKLTTFRPASPTLEECAMPSRRVRFASTDTFYSPPPPPLIDSSPSSSTSSLGPRTPPPLAGPQSHRPPPPPLRGGIPRARRLSSAALPLLVTPHLPWNIPVPASNRRYVSVGDILSAIYRTLRVNATPAEFNALGTEKLMRRASTACTRRCERLRGHSGYSQEKREGVKRVDFLMGYTTFQGIAPTSGAPDVWQLTIS
ncbi:hypothetical protein B0H14DRAFT_2739153 [Mycena olivaceomarginata]|nr:hypothetical protein B0H14DRAFT_2739153 [Mycena olivaceomarginata]